MLNLGLNLGEVTHARNKGVPAIPAPDPIVTDTVMLDSYIMADAVEVTDND